MASERPSMIAGRGPGRAEDARRPAGFSVQGAHPSTVINDNP